MIRPIVIDRKELRIPCAAIFPGEDISEIIKDLEETFATLKGYGLAAPQIGIKKKVAIIRYGRTHIDLINPVITGKEDPFIHKGECCFSVGHGKIPIDTDRFNSIIFKNGIDEQCFASSNMEAVVIQHEIDHLNGLTILDRKHKRK